jgi:DNA-binding transcriptional LysR family regulator
MEIQELTTFVSVAQYNSFSRAAAHLGYSQAAVTIQIRHLEDELDVRLFDRLGKKISLTSHGKVFYEHAVRILNDLAAAKDAVRQDELLTGSLMLGTIDSLCSSVLPAILQEYHRRYPGVSISVTTDTPNVLLDMLQNNVLDIVYLLDEELNDPRWVKVLDARESAVFAAAAGYVPDMKLISVKAENKSKIKEITDNHIEDSKKAERQKDSAKQEVCHNRYYTVEQLLQYPFILTEKDASYRRVLDSMLLLRHQEINPCFESNNTDLILNMVRQQTGITFLPEYAIARDLAEGTIVRLEVPDLQIHVWRQLIHHKDKWVNREMDAFFRLVREIEGN